MRERFSTPSRGGGGGRHSGPGEFHLYDRSLSGTVRRLSRAGRDRRAQYEPASPNPDGKLCALLPSRLGKGARKMTRTARRLALCLRAAVAEVRTPFHPLGFTRVIFRHDYPVTISICNPTAPDSLPSPRTPRGTPWPTLPSPLNSALDTGLSRRAPQCQRGSDPLRPSREVRPLTRKRPPLNRRNLGGS